MENFTGQKGLAHELGNVLAVMSGYLDLLAGENLSEGQEILVGKMYAALDDIKQILANAPRVRAARLRTFLEKLVSSCEVFSSPKGINLEFRSELDDEEFLIEDNKLAQVVINLIKNAAKYTDKGNITVYAGISGVTEVQDLEVGVKDTGVGISEEYLRHIFDPFVQASSDRSGSGIGLAICKNLVEDMGGEIWALSEPGKGSSFCFRLPVKKAY